MFASDKPALWKGRAVALYEIHYDEDGNPKAWQEGAGDGSLVWYGKLTDEIDYEGEHAVMLRCDGPDSWLRRQLNSARPDRPIKVQNASISLDDARELQRIAETGSISAAGREMGMSYKRAWSLVETMNAMFEAPLVDSARGGPGGGGATLTETGQRVLALYRRIEADASAAAAPSVAALKALLRNGPG